MFGAVVPQLSKFAPDAVMLLLVDVSGESRFLVPRA